jgi:branched-chain amino acid transport system substrate-binding protein
MGTQWGSRIHHARFTSRIAAAVLIAALAVVPLAGTAADPVEINAILAMTGASGFIGKEAATALGIEQDTINRGGGIGGRPVKFVIQDDQSSAQIAVQLANGLLAKDAPVIIGPHPVAACSAVAPLLVRKAVMFCLSAGYHPPPSSNFYVAGVSTVDQVIFAVRYLRARGVRRIASITSIDFAGQDIDHSLAVALALPENRDIKLVAAERFNITDITVDAQMARIKASRAQVLYAGNNGSPLGVVLHGYTDLGLDLPLITTNASLNSIAMAQFSAILPKEFLVAGSLSDGPEVVPPGPEKAQIRIFTNAFHSAGYEPDHALGLTWDPAMIVVAAYRKYGPNATAAQIDDFIRNLHAWPGVSGEYDFRNGNQSGLSPDSLVMVRWNPERKTWLAVSKPGGGAPGGVRADER